MTPGNDDVEILQCPDCGAEYEKSSYCGDYGYGLEAGGFVGGENAHAPEPVYARSVNAQPFPVHEPAWCPYCVAWLGTFPSADEARASERSLADHPVEFCERRIAKLSGSEEWRLRHEAGKRGSLAMAKPGSPRVSRKEVGA